MKVYKNKKSKNQVGMGRFFGYSFLALAMVFLCALFYYNLGLTSSVASDGEPAIFTVKPGETVGEIGANLFSAGFINSKFIFKVYVWRQNLEGDLQAGEYMLNPEMTVPEIVDYLKTGRSLSREREIKIIEGWNISEIDAYLSKEGLGKKEEFSKLANAGVEGWRSQAGNLDIWSGAPAKAGLEGYLFPDTYRIFRDATLDDIIIKMLNNLDRKITPKMRGEIKKRGRTIYDIITMASIIEKEVRATQDKRIVAGILYKRMKVGMKLEVDATINYITGKNNPSSSLADLKINSPYNTYMYYGLPPGPIANPGLDAIYAAIYPKKSAYLFYLNRQDTGETIFSKTYDEHLRNKGKYLN